MLGFFTGLKLILAFGFLFLCFGSRHMFLFAEKLNGLSLAKMIGSGNPLSNSTLAPRVRARASGYCRR
jgi:hypothetical protein